jgi:dolichyl-phosphate-mannose-protein mannosyltransferase
MFSKITAFLRKEWVLVLILLILAVITRFYMLGEPNRIVFDELYFAKFVSHYFLDSYYFDIHPPLAKLIMAGAANIAGVNPILTFGYNAINEPYPDTFYVLLRSMVSLIGSLLPLGVYALARSLRFSKLVAFLAGFFIVFDNAILVQSRFILTDAFLLTFGVFGLACVIWSLRAERSNLIPRYWLLVIGSLFIGASYSVKWTGLLFLGMALLYVLLQFFTPLKISMSRSGLRSAIREGAQSLPAQAGGYKHNSPSPLSLRGGIIPIITILIISFLVYGAALYAHLTQLTKTGPGDAFMTPAFQSTLTGNPRATPDPGETPLEKPSLTQKFTELNTRMYTASAGITATHPYGSKWYTWPLMQRTVYYWQNTVDDTHQQRIYLLGNPLIWWSGLIAILFLAGWSIMSFLRKQESIRSPLLFSVLFLLFGYAANLIAYIPISRVAFLYHYFPSFVFLSILLAFAASKLRNKWIIGALILLVVAVFLWFSPLSYGTPLTDQQFQQRMILKSWE